jgi:aldose 1-epimerase
VLGYDTLDGYLKRTPYFGALIGRYGNRVAKGKFTLNGQQYTLATNNGPNALHGGIKTFDKVVWQVESHSLDQSSMPALKLRYVSKDGEEGYPGTLDVTELSRAKGLTKSEMIREAIRQYVVREEFEALRKKALIEAQRGGGPYSDEDVFKDVS